LIRAEQAVEGGYRLQALYNTQAKALQHYNDIVKANRKELEKKLKEQLGKEQTVEEKLKEDAEYEKANFFKQRLIDAQRAGRALKEKAGEAAAAALDTAVGAAKGVARVALMPGDMVHTLSWNIVGRGMDWWNGNAEWGDQMRQWGMEAQLQEQETAKEARDAAEAAYKAAWDQMETMAKINFEELDEDIKAGLSEKEQRAVQLAMYVFGVTPYRVEGSSSIGYKHGGKDVTELKAFEWTQIFNDSANNRFVRDSSMNPTDFRASVQNKKLPEDDKQKKTMLNILRALQASRRVIQSKYQNDTEVRTWYQTLGSLTTQLPTK